MVELRPGWQTTEFWITVATSIISVLVVTGVLKAEDSAALKDATARAVESAAALIAAGATAWRYLQSRAEVKKAVADAVKSQPIMMESLGEVTRAVPPKTVRV